MTQGYSKTYHSRITYRSSGAQLSNSSINGPSGFAYIDFGSVTENMDSSVSFGANYPDWKTRISRGMDATTTMSGTVMRILNASEGVYHAAYSQYLIGSPTRWESREDFGSGFLGITGVFYTPSFSQISLTTATNRALARFNAACAGVNRQFQGGVFFAELQKTLHGIRHPAEALFKGIESYCSAATKLRRSFVKSKADFLSLSRNQRRQVSKSFSKAATGLWLENSFHWLPLMYDIQGAVSALTHTFDRVPSQFVKASATDVQSKTVTTGSGGFSRLVQSIRVTQQSSGASVKFYGRVRVGPRVSLQPDLKALGFDPRSFVPTVWELIPYSWAVDYFTNIGDILYGASYGGEDRIWTAIGTKKWGRRVERSGIIPNPQDFQPTPGWAMSYAYATMKEPEVATETAQITRAPYIGSYIPSFEYKVPGLSLKWLNLGAAFLQRSLAFL